MASARAELDMQFRVPLFRVTDIPELVAWYSTPSQACQIQGQASLQWNRDHNLLECNDPACLDETFIHNPTTGKCEVWGTGTFFGGGPVHYFDAVYEVRVATNTDKTLGCSANLKGDPCDVSTGNQFHSEIDLPATAGLPAISRFYNSGLAMGFFSRGFAPHELVMGQGWTGTQRPRFETIRGQPNTLILRRPDGRGLTFRYNGAVWQPDADVGISLAGDGRGGVIATLRDGTIERYARDGGLSSLTDPAGRTTTYDHGGENVTAIMGPFGHRLTLGYNSYSLLSSITDPEGRAITYEYLNPTGTAGGGWNLTRVNYPDGTAKLYHYEDPVFRHYLTGVSYVAADGQVSRYTTFVYGDIIGKATRDELAGGMQRFTFRYDSDTQTTVTDAANNAEVMTFQDNLGMKNLVAKVNATDGKSFTQIFDANNNLTCQKDEEGRVMMYTYNTTNQKTSQTEGLSGTCAAPQTTSATRTTMYQYLSATRDLPTVIESPSVNAGSLKRTEIAYQGNLPTSITQRGYAPGGTAVSRTVALQYNSSGQVTRIDGPRTDVNDVTTLACNECTSGGGCGQLRSITNALGHVTTYDFYDANGRLLRMTDPNGLVTNYSYDPRGRVRFVTRTPPSGAARTTEYRYNAAGEVTFVAFPDGRTLTYTYNDAQKLVRVTDNLGHRVDYAYDSRGNRTTESTYDPDGTLVRLVESAHDARNRVASLNSGGSLTQQIHDAIGNLVSQVDPNRNPATTHDYDALNRLIRTIDALGGATGYAYDPDNRLKQVTAPNSVTTTYEYDDLGNLLQEQSPDRGTLAHSYDAAGNLVSTVDARGAAVSYTYDALNRMTFVDYPGETEDMTYTYDNGPSCGFGVGRLCQTLDESGTTQVAYDAFGNVTEQLKTELGVTYRTAYAYDPGDRLTAITYPDGRLVTYARDALGRITTVTATVNGVSTVIATGRTYRADGILTGQRYGNGLTEVRHYDLQGQLTYQSLGSADTRVYAYDPNGNLTRKQSLPEAGVYAYDALDRLTQTTRDSGSDAYAYDGNGNRLSDSTRIYGYASGTNRLTRAGSVDATLDAAGNILTDGTGREYRYNQAGRLFEVYVDGAKVATYTYNALGQRTRQVTAEGTRFYHYDITGRLLAETDETQTPRRAYVYADSAPLAQYALDPVTDPRPLPGSHANPNNPGKGQEKGKGAEAVQAHRPTMPGQSNRPGTSSTSASGEETLVYLHTDYLSTPRLATDANAVKVWSWEGEAFGMTPPDEDPDGDGKKTVVSLRYPGQYFDSESELYYNWNRYYDPKIGRYISSDPIGLEGGLNTYLYARANPLKYIDPKGLLNEFPGDTEQVYNPCYFTGSCNSDTFTERLKAEGRAAGKCLACVAKCEAKVLVGAGTEHVAEKQAEKKLKEIADRVAREYAMRGLKFFGWVGVAQTGWDAAQCLVECK